jgi:hypothetical protein
VDGYVPRERPDELGFGPSGPPRIRLPRWRRGRRMVAGALVVIALVVIAVAAVVPARQGHRRPFGAGPVTVIDAGRRLLGVRAGWEVFATGPGVLLRVRLAAGLVTRTTVPALLSTGPVFFVVGPRQAVIRPLDYVPGYLVPDGRPARPLPAALGRAGEAFPGPRAGQLWVQTGFGAHVVMSLADFADRRAGGSVTFPGPLGYTAVPDGRGYFLVQDGGAVYDVRPGRRWRVASGTLDAAGPSAWLVTGCPGARCRYEVIDPASGARRILPGRAPGPGPATAAGVTSPDGLVAAVPGQGPDHSPVVHLINLATGADRVLSFNLSHPAGLGDGGPSLAWAPDSRWLLAVTANGALIAIDPATGGTRGLGVALPPVSQLAIRPAV